MSPTRAGGEQRESSAPDPRAGGDPRTSRRRRLEPAEDADTGQNRSSSGGGGTRSSRCQRPCGGYADDDWSLNRDGRRGPAADDAAVFTISRRTPRSEFRRKACRPRVSSSSLTTVFARTATAAAAFLALVLLVSLAPVDAAVACRTTEECETKLRPGSVCRPDSNTCSNPFEGGCLRRILGQNQFPAARICNSDDTRLRHGAQADGDGSEQQPGEGETVCVPSSFNYTEIRIAPGNWESSMFLAFILQIILSELVGVPASIETSTYDLDGNPVVLSFYDPEYRFPYPGKAYAWDALENANAQPMGDCAPALARGEPCAHNIPEVWNGQQKQWSAAQKSGYIEAPEGNDMVGKLSWYIPAFVARDDPSLLSFYGLQGEQYRRKLAEYFKTPTTWSEYCSIVSIDGCAADDGIAARAPTASELEDGPGAKYIVTDLYRGHFRDTPESNCTLNPSNCTGHFVDCPCTWSTNFAQQSYWNDIFLDSRGALEPNLGYSYGDMLDIWSAANETRSPIIMWWWKPDPTVQMWEGTEASYQRVTLPEPTEQCQRARISPKDRCDEDVWVRRGDEDGKCGDESHSLRKIVASSLGEITYNSPAASRSPAYDVIKAFGVNDLAVDALLRMWIGKGKDQYGYDPRETVCEWVADNLDTEMAWIPRGYPRTLVEEGWYSGAVAALLWVGMALGVVVTVAVIAVGALTHRHRSKRVFVYAQHSFLLIILSGFLLVSCAGAIYGLEPTKASCTAKQWLVVLGYTLGLVPLLVKVAAINRMMQQAKRMKRVHLTPSQLLGAVVAVTVAIAGFLIAWTVVDPVTRQEDQVLVEEKGTLVEVRVSCSSNSEGWQIAALAWEILLLVCASVLSFQARKVRQEFNEAHSLTSLVYSHFVFMVVRAVLYILAIYGVLATNVQAGVTSLVLSLDTAAALVIYFGPKLYRAVVKGDDTSSLIRSGSSAQPGGGYHSEYGVSKLKFPNGSQSNLVPNFSDSGYYSSNASSSCGSRTGFIGGKRRVSEKDESECEGDDDEDGNPRNSASNANRANEIWFAANKRALADDKKRQGREGKVRILEGSDEDSSSRSSRGRGNQNSSSRSGNGNGSSRRGSDCSSIDSRDSNAGYGTKPPPQDDFDDENNNNNNKSEAMDNNGTREASLGGVELAVVNRSEPGRRSKKRVFFDSEEGNGNGDTKTKTNQDALKGKNDTK